MARSAGGRVGPIVVVVVDAGAQRSRHCSEMGSAAGETFRSVAAALALVRAGRAGLAAGFVVKIASRAYAVDIDGVKLPVFGRVAGQTSAGGRASRAVVQAGLAES